MTAAWLESLEENHWVAGDSWVGVTASKVFQCSFCFLLWWFLLLSSYEFGCIIVACFPVPCNFLIFLFPLVSLSVVPSSSMFFFFKGGFLLLYIVLSRFPFQLTCIILFLCFCLFPCHFLFLRFQAFLNPFFLHWFLSFNIDLPAKRQGIQGWPCFIMLHTPGEYWHV